MTDAELIALYRDIFAEITAKATALEFDPADPERIIAYRVPCGPIHRAAGKLGFQMFDGDKYLAMAIEKIRELEAEVAKHKSGGGLRPSFGTPIPNTGPEPITLSAGDIGFTLDMSEETRREIEEIERNAATAVHRARNFIMD
jgi:hypothetical protein